ncbi:membrane protein insertion efficiency factor YidD [bacterium]|nr:membrane protein insertion efficiency factor YidD [bacterium]
MMLKILIQIIGIYQRYLSPLIGPTCRFYPSCSTYAKESLMRHGLLKGLWYSAVRILKCHPYHPGGYDPVK